VEVTWRFQENRAQHNSTRYVNRRRCGTRTDRAGANAARYGTRSVSGLMREVQCAQRRPILQLLSHRTGWNSTLLTKAFASTLSL
jgi:hypothetical protein